MKIKKSNPSMLPDNAINTIINEQEQEVKIKELGELLEALVTNFNLYKDKVDGLDVAVTTEGLSAIIANIEQIIGTTVFADVHNGNSFAFSQNGLSGKRATMTPGTIVYARNGADYILLIYGALNMFIAFSNNDRKWYILENGQLQFEDGTNDFDFWFIGKGAAIGEVVDGVNVRHTILKGITLNGVLNLEFENIQSFENLSITDTLTVKNIEGLEEEVNITNNLHVTGETVLDGDVTVNADVEQTGDNTINGTLFVNGDIVQRGQSYETEVETLKVKDELIKTRDGATVGLASGEYTGLQAEKYNGINDGQLVFDKNGEARVGDVGDTQPLATRSEKTDMVDGSFLKWDGENNKIVSSEESPAIIDDASTDTTHAWSGKKVDDTVKAFFNTIYPVGCKYEQLPGFASPNDMWGNISTWQEVKFGGAFFRSEGGDAKPFTDPMTVTSVSGNAITVNALVTDIAVGDLVIAGDEYRTITGINGTTITVDSAFTRSDLTVVILGQSAGVPNITGEELGTDMSTYTESKGAFYKVEENGKRSPASVNNLGATFYFAASKGETKLDGTLKNDVYGKSNRVTTDNITVKYWKRIA